MLEVTLHFACGGCSAEIDVVAYAKREFKSFSGRGHGIGAERTVWPDLEKITPQGWVAFDPYTHVTYCPQCWKEIMKGGDADVGTHRTV